MINTFYLRKNRFQIEEFIDERKAKTESKEPQNPSFNYKGTDKENYMITHEEYKSKKEYKRITQVPRYNLSDIKIDFTHE